jgi:hypothetical protein
MRVSAHSVLDSLHCSSRSSPRNHTARLATLRGISLGNNLLRGSIVHWAFTKLCGVRLALTGLSSLGSKFK